MQYNVNKKVSYVFVFCSFFTLGCFSQEAKSKVVPNQSIDTKQADSIEIRIKRIREEFGRINSDSSKYKVVQKDIEGQSAEGGLARKFYYNDTLKKLVTVFYGETGKLTSEYYFKNAEIIFLFEKEERYSSPIYTGKSKAVEVTENRYYLNKDKLIRWIGKAGKIINPQDYPTKEVEILRDVNDFK